MDQNELEYHKTLVESKNLAEKLRLVKHAITCALGGFCTYLLFGFFRSCLQSPEPVLRAFASIADKFQLGSTLGVLWGGLMTAAWALEHRGRKRAVKLKGEYQEKLERNESNRTSSGLNHHGEAPEGIEERLL